MRLLPLLQSSGLIESDIPDDVTPDNIGVKIGAKARFFRGETSSNNGGMAVYGAGLYTTTNRKYAANFGTVRELKAWEALPDNPVRFKTTLDWDMWLQRLDQHNGILGARDRGMKHNDIGNYIRQTFPEIDGVQIGTGLDAIFVIWPVSE